MKRIIRDTDGNYSVNLNQNEIILLVSGYIPYIIFERDPQIPESEYLWINYVPIAEDLIPPIFEPFPCRILSYVSFVNPIHILTLSPDEFSIDFIEIIKEFKRNMEKSDEFVRSTTLLPQTQAPTVLLKALHEKGSRPRPARRV